MNYQVEDKVIRISWILLALYAAWLFLAPRFLSEASTYGVQYLTKFSPLTQGFSLLFVVSLFVPASNAWWRKGAAALAARLDALPPNLRRALLLVGGAGIFWFFRSRTLYGDGSSTIYHLGVGERMNWKEPLDRLVTSGISQLGQLTGLWTPEKAIAGVSVFAGLCWLVTSSRLSSLMSRRNLERLCWMGFLLTPGIMQLFFGNIENYSLLAAGLLAYIYFGHVYLAGTCGFFWPCITLALTCSIHLSAAWLLPTLGVLFVVKSPALSNVLLRWKDFMLGVLGCVVPALATLAIGMVIQGSAKDLNFRTFGGGDGRCLKPLFHVSGQYEKFPLFSIEHAVALTNHMLLIASIASLLCAVVLITRACRKTFWTRENIFLSSTVIFSMAYIILFNPDMAFANVGLLNEWDLFSLPAVFLAAWAPALLREIPSENERDALALAAIGLSFLSTAAWVLYNAKIVF